MSNDAHSQSLAVRPIVLFEVMHTTAICRSRSKAFLWCFEEERVLRAEHVNLFLASPTT